LSPLHFRPKENALNFPSLTAIAGLLLLAALPGFAATVTFEELSDSQVAGDFYSGVQFSNAVAHTAGISLNDAELPPHSGNTVVLNDLGPIQVDWASPVSDFQAFFTYAAHLTLEFSLDGNTIGTETSAFDNNLALSGDPGSSANERISFAGHGLFDSVRIESDGAYGLDDVSYGAVAQATPEPNLAPVILAAFLFAPYFLRRIWRRSTDK
jgi:hypothetical protein